MLFKQSYCLLSLFFVLSSIYPSMLENVVRSRITQKKMKKGFFKKKVRTDVDNDNKFSYAYYQSAEEITRHLEYIRDRHIPGVTLRNATFETETVMGRRVKIMEIKGVQETAVNTIMVVAGIHGRDWQGVASAMYLVNQLSFNQRKYEKLIEKYRWVVIPLINPDGYNFSMSNCFWGTEVREWTKNVQQTWTYYTGIRNVPSIDRCAGVDPDNNFEYQWISYDYENLTRYGSMCQKNFPGYFVRSTYETSFLSELIGAQNENGVSLFISIREGGRLVGHPYSYTKREPPYPQFKKAAELVERAAKAAGYKHGQSSDLLELTAGHIEDYVESHFSIPYSITLRVRETSTNKRRTQANIKSRCQRAFKAITSLARHHRVGAGGAGGAGGASPASPLLLHPLAILLVAANVLFSYGLRGT